MFSRKLVAIQPSQLFISSEKLARVMEQFNPSIPESLEPIPVKELDGEVIFTDGHTRALAAYLSGLAEVMVFWDEDELDWEAYRICVKWCKTEGIYTIASLQERVVSPQDYVFLWLKRCERMQNSVEDNRRG